jgi:Protein of unknown function (DUF3500)
MAECAKRFLGALDADQRKALFPFNTDERMNWHFIPRERTGLPLLEMTLYQKHLASALLATGLSQGGYIKAVTIMSLEDVLRILEDDSGERRNPEKYYFSLFGTPSDSGTWGYRIEGHHLSQNYTVVDGKAIDAPSFFGSNPAELRQGPRKGLRPRRERRLRLRADPCPRRTTAEARDRGRNRIQGHPDCGEPESGADYLLRLSGGIDRGDPHYYRVQTSSFLIELDDTQDNANHIHSVWRDFAGDFGHDLLQQH